MVFQVYTKYFTEPSWVVCSPNEEKNSKRRKYLSGPVHAGCLTTNKT